MVKSSTCEQNVEAVRLLMSRGVYIQMGMILFDPDTTISELEENFRFLRDNPWPVTKGIFTEMFAAPGTVFTEQLSRRGLITPSDSDPSFRYKIIDPRARRVHAILKSWQKSHSGLYDWVVDSLTAPKVMTEDGYKKVYSLYQLLRQLDLQMFEAALVAVNNNTSDVLDENMVQAFTNRSQGQFCLVREEIGRIYRDNGMVYVAISNPFLV
jgi:hypothetical protein